MNRTERTIKSLCQRLRGRTPEQNLARNKQRRVLALRPPPPLASPGICEAKIFLNFKSSFSGQLMKLIKNK